MFVNWYSDILHRFCRIWYLSCEIVQLSARCRRLQ